MPDTVPQPNPFGKVARAARLRALSATPPAPNEGGPPFDHALPNWLLEVTPLGADVFHTNVTVLPLTAPQWTDVEPPARMETGTDASGRRWHRSQATADAYRPVRHPTEAPRTDQRVREQRISEAWQRAHALCLALHEAGIGPRSSGRGSLALAETALWLAGPATREPGVPIFAELALASGSRLSDRSRSLLSGPRWGRNGANVLRVECATSHDLASIPVVQLSRAQGWKDHEDHAGRPAGASSAKRAVREGRLLLHQLGAWPWAHAPRGRLHEYPSWWEDDRFLTPLRTWIAQSWGRLLFDEVRRHRGALTLEPQQGVAAGASATATHLLEEEGVGIIVALDADRMLATLTQAGQDKPAKS